MRASHKVLNHHKYQWPAAMTTHWVQQPPTVVKYILICRKLQADCPASADLSNPWICIREGYSRLPYLPEDELHQYEQNCIMSNARLPLTVERWGENFTTLHCPCFSSVALAVKEMLWSWHQMLHTSSCLPLFMIANGVWSVALHPDCHQNKTLPEEFACILPTTTRLAGLAAGFFNKYKGEWIIKEVLCLVERGERGGGMTTAATTTTHLGSSWENQALAKEVIV